MQKNDKINKLLNFLKNYEKFNTVFLLIGFSKKRFTSFIIIKTLYLYCPSFLMKEHKDFLDFSNQVNVPFYSLILLKNKDSLPFFFKGPLSLKKKVDL